MRSSLFALACLACTCFAKELKVDMAYEDAKADPTKMLAALLQAARAEAAWQNVAGGHGIAAHRSVHQRQHIQAAKTTGLIEDYDLLEEKQQIVPTRRGDTSMSDTATATATTFPKLPASVKPGVVTGQALVDLLNHAKENKWAIPGVNIVGTSSINACMEAAKKYGGPIMVTFSRGGGQFIAGKAADNTDDAAAIAGAVAGAKHVREVAALYGVPVILHTDHCMKSWLPWFDGLLEADEEYFKAYGEPLFSSHMLDLSEEPLEENVAICKKYMERMAKINCLLEMELGVTGGEEDGVDNSDVDSSRLYTQPEEVWYTYQELSSIPNAAFTVAASFGNVHGVYAPGNVDLKPVILHNTQAFIKDKLGTDNAKPVSFVFHGGSGSSVEDIQYAIEAGVIKMNIDTDTQWAFWDGVRAYEADKHDYLQGQIGNPEGPEKPNKKYYDPRMMLRAGEEAMAERLVQAAKDLNCVDVL